MLISKIRKPKSEKIIVVYNVVCSIIGACTVIQFQVIHENAGK